MGSVILLLALTSVMLFVGSRRVGEPRLRKILSATSLLAMIGAIVAAFIAYT